MTARRAFLSAALAALAAVVTLLLPVTIASASSAPGAGTRVEASRPVMIFAVGPSRAVLAVQGRCESIPQPQIVSGACVAGSGAAQTLFRAGSRDPEEIFSRGFERKGGNMNLWEHVRQNPPDSGFVSTTKSLSSAQSFAAAKEKIPYIYRLRANGIDVNATFSADSPFPCANEIAVPDSIPASSIEGAWGPGGWIFLNPSFAP